MKLTLEEIDSIIDALAKAIFYAKEARHVAKKVHGDDKEVVMYLEYVADDIEKATKLLAGVL